ncbi:hypothetical protein QG37_06639 [Candidozyma auris]|uniref:Uncharacterized protein n=1 Tax=Candidozyma auris TaxID=498019 RepID=A0A0L0NS07_CANAR|nr:hypothetical protein QG37_06639 [[Candida] auris]
MKMAFLGPKVTLEEVMVPLRLALYSSASEDLFESRFKAAKALIGALGG